MDKKTKPINPEFSVFLAQVTAVGLIVVAVLVIKAFGGDLYELIRSFYIGNFQSDTSVNEVIDLSEEGALESDLISKTQTIEVISTVKTEGTKSGFNNRLMVPVADYVLTSGYGYRIDPIDGGIEFHKGVDLATEKGNIIMASATGKVILAQYSNSYGNYIIIDHGNGLNTLYAHCDSLLKNVGDIVCAGEIIANVGSTGRSTGPHLHFEIILNGSNLNPQHLISE